MTTTDDRTRLRACRRLARSFPDKTAKERLATIADIATGKAEPTIAKTPLSADVHERIAAGQASRAKGNAKDRIAREAKKEEAETKRKQRGTRNRQEMAGLDRTTDLHG